MPLPPYHSSLNSAGNLAVPRSEKVVTQPSRFWIAQNYLAISLFHTTWSRTQANGYQFSAQSLYFSMQDYLLLHLSNSVSNHHRTSQIENFEGQSALWNFAKDSLLPRQIFPIGGTR